MSHRAIDLIKVGGILMWRICLIKGIVHPKLKMWCLSAYPQGIQYEGDSRLGESKKHTQTKPNETLQHMTISMWWISGKKNIYKYCSVSCTDRSFLVFRPQSIVRSRRVSLGFVSVCFFDFPSRESHWLQLYDWLTATVWVKNLCMCSTEETKSPTSWMPWG